MGIMWMLLLRRWSLGVAAWEDRMCLPVLWVWNGTVALLSVMGRVPTWIAGMRLPVLRIWHRTMALLPVWGGVPTWRI